MCVCVYGAWRDSFEHTSVGGGEGHGVSYRTKMNWDLHEFFMQQLCAKLWHMAGKGPKTFGQTEFFCASVKGHYGSIGA